MKKFSDLVPKQSGNLTGVKYHIDEILNREIHLKGFTVKPSKYEDGALTLQYDIEEQLKENGSPVIDDGYPVTDWVEHITFTGSKALIRQLDGGG